MIDPATILAQAVADLEGRMGVHRADILPEEWLALSKAALRFADPFRDVNADAAGFPVILPDGTALWRLTIGAQIWLDELERSLDGGTANPLYSRAVVFACAHARDRDAFPQPSPREAERAVTAFERSLRITRAEAASALKRLSSRSSADGRAAPGQSAAIDWAALCARLETQTGISAHDWCWKHSGDYTIKAWNDLHDFAAAFSPRAKQHHVQDEADRALEALQLAKVAIRKRIHPS